jgi:HAE1 family hydrophobic/amphiphilic exporter-1
VVLENIDRHRSMGKSAALAAYDGTREVWGAVLASTLTTVAVFLPVVFVQEEAGQLFKDIAIAVTCAIFLSLFVSVSVIPMLARYLYRGESTGRMRLNAPLVGLGSLAISGFMAVVGLCLRNAATRIATVVLFTGLAAGTVWALFPPMEYLPQGNRNLILSILIPPPGLSMDERKEMGAYLSENLSPHLGQAKDGFPGIRDMFYVSSPEFNLIGAISDEEQRARELIPLFNRWVNSMPGVFGVSLQASIFEQRLGRGRAISLDLSGPELPKLIGAGGALFGAVSQAIPGSQVRPIPSLEMSYPEVVLVPDRERLSAAGLSAMELGLALDVLMDGRKVGEFKEEGKKSIDLVLRGIEADTATPEALYASLVSTPTGQAVPISSLADRARSYGLPQIRHLERRRTITLEITPPATMPLEAAMQTLDQGILPEIRAQGLLDGVLTRMSGAADKLTTTREALQGNFLMALIISYLLMSALFGNFIYPLVILFTVPLAAAGGFLGLALENVFIAPQPLDVLTMLGFIILVGVVVNNAILIVHQSLNNMREHAMAAKEAVLAATRSRLRPIYMSAATSIFGMLPLAIAPGPGSELYRGLGAVVLGGLAVSTFFTVFVIPSLLLFFLWMERPAASVKAAE